MTTVSCERLTNNVTLRRGYKRTHSDVPVKDHEDISWIEKICNQKHTVEEQVPLIISEIEAQAPYYKCASFMTKDLCCVFNSFYYRENIRVVVFGSAFTNLALKNSDIDVFLDFGGELPLPAHKLTKNLRNKLKKNKIFRKVIPILAKVPIVRCVAVNDITFDISFTNLLGVVNSKLIKFFLTFNERIRPLILILKFLLKKEGLIGTSSLSSFGLITLIIFFLQQLEKPVLPPVKQLQVLATTRYTVAGWDTSFCKDITQLKIDNQSEYTLVELLTKFFELYAKFEFGIYVICPFTAKIYVKPVFAHLDLVPEDFHCYRENVTKNISTEFELNKCMCVQDPFNHSHNVTKNMVQNKIIQFQKLCEQSLELCKEELENVKKKEYKSDFFKKLFSQDIIADEKKKTVKNKITIHTDKFEMYSNPKLCTEDEFRYNWSRVVMQRLIHILTNILKCKVNIVSKEECDKKSVNFKNADVIALLKCELKYFDLVSQKRREMKHMLELPNNMPLMHQEEMISKHICQTVLNAENQIPFKFDAMCYTEKGPTCFCIDLQCEGRHFHKQTDHQFYKFMKLFVPKLIAA